MIKTNNRFSPIIIHNNTVTCGGAGVFSEMFRVDFVYQMSKSLKNFKQKRNKKITVLIENFLQCCFPFLQPVCLTHIIHLDIFL